MLATGPWYRRPDAPLLVGHLMASAPPRSPVANAGSSALSILIHASLLSLAVVLTAGGGARLANSPAPDLFLPVVPLDEPPPPPPVVQAPSDVGGAGAAALHGFKLLAPPTVMPTDLPPIRPGFVLNEADYQGVGAPGGSATGTRTAEGPPAEDIAAAPIFVPVTVAPELKNRAAVERALARAYPPMLRDAGVTGRVLVWVLVDEAGEVVKALVKETSGVQPLDDAALGVARAMRFSPGMNRDVRVKVWVAVPVDFRMGS